MGRAAKITRVYVGYEDMTEYTLENCQEPAGGLRDKPGSPVDLYHTYYALVGLYALRHDDFDIVLGIPII